MPITLNGFRVDFSAATFTANVLDVPDPEAMRSYRERNGHEWFFHWRSGKAYAIPRVATPSETIGTPTEFRIDDHDHLHFLVARLNDVLPNAFTSYEAFQQRPFSFLGKKDEIVDLVTKSWRNVPPLVRERNLLTVAFDLFGTAFGW